MYNKESSLTTNLSVAVSLDNLTNSSHKNGTYLAVHDSEKISLILIGSTGNTETREIVFEAASDDNRNLIQRVKLVQLRDTLLLVAASSRAVKVYSVEADLQLVLSHTLGPEHKLGQIVHSIETLNKTVLGVGTQSKVYFFVSNNAGTNIKYKDLHQDLRSNTRSFLYNFTANGHSQCAVEESVGLITVWKVEEGKHTFSKVRSIEVHPNTKSTILRMFNNTLVLATISGQIQIISLNTGHLMCEIQAHVRCITSFDICANQRYLVTASEDSHLRVFQLEHSTDDNCHVELLHQMTIDNEMICGVKFLDPNATQMAISCYESSYIKLFTINP